MLTTTLRGMLAHKLRLALTTASIALGVAFLAGTLVLTDTMGTAFDRLFDKVAAGTDAVVRTEAAYSASEGVSTSRAPIDAAVLDQVEQVEGVRAAEGSVSGYALLTDTDGDAVIPPGGLPTTGATMSADEKLRGDVKVLAGEAPDGPHEVAIDATSAEENDIEVGSTIKILFQGPTEEFTVVGTVGFGDDKDLGGSTSAYFDVATAQRVLGTPGVFDTIEVSADPGISQAELAERLSAVVPEGTEAVTGDAVSKENADAVKSNMKMINILFSIFAGIALFVGGFIIWNTFTMIVTQRSREIALMRAIGATKRQIKRSLLFEAILIGAGASAIGVALGLGVAKGLKVLMDVAGFSLPTTSLQVEPRTIIISMAVGTLVTVVSALVPARRATKVRPVEALRESAADTGSFSKRRALVGTTVLGLGTAGVLSTLYADAPMVVFGVGLLSVLVGVIVALPMAVRPLAAAIGAPMKLRGLSGELATQNAVRNPRRTAATAAALMIGLTLVVSMSVFASSLKTSFGEVIGDKTDADLYVTSASSQGPGFSPTVVAAVEDVEGVDSVAASGWGMARFEGHDTSYSAVDPATAGDLMQLDLSQGSLSELGDDTVVVSRDIAESNGWELGDTVDAEFAATGKHQLELVGIFDSKGWVTDNFVIGLDEQNALAGPQLVTSALVKVAAGADRDEVQDAITAALADHPDAKVLDQDAYEAEASGFIDGLLTFVTVMLLLAVVIALLGIVNTLALSVFERTRELGLLRAVGMTRGQVRAMVRWESVVISLIGALSGAGLGIGIGVALSRVLEDQGITGVSIPAPQIAVYVVLAAVAGVLAALGPARSAAKVDVLKAVVTD
ncbi:ABC transporter permease [Nocardioides bizhenqiangii]|uniref:FtsX-like permease family protein n=1 Tax=Nocardioides bizhenqiangii TaxID=3095076 RepID=A0ABZ0ZQN3_9ACTN|nr:FtsX-like permease family protein [Nocardioides sp. HM61]WQQ26577.1 FtsX-like permease family protein [Nocardioides sp. HM61]